MSIINRDLLRNYSESVLKVFRFLGSLKVWSLRLKSLGWFLILKVNVPIDLRLFKGKLKPLQAIELKKYGVGGGRVPGYGKYRPLWLPD